MNGNVDRTIVYPGVTFEYGTRLWVVESVSQMDGFCRCYHELGTGGRECRAFHWTVVAKAVQEGR